MAKTTTGLNSWLGETGTNYFHELTRQAFRLAEEMAEEAIPNNGIPRTVAVIRKTETVAANSALGVKATWGAVAGLDAIESLILYPRQWNESSPQELKILKGERTIIVVDVPSAGGVSADKIALTDRIKYNDPTYGESYWEIVDVEPHQGSGLIRCRVKFDRQDS